VILGLRLGLHLGVQGGKLRGLRFGVGERVGE
jgi:hypothetical protein